MLEGTHRSAVGLTLSIVPSLAILGSVFFFINSACFADNDAEEDVRPCEFAADVAAPAGASVSFFEPSTDQTFEGTVAGFVHVPVTLRATGVEITASSVCRAGTGHFLLSIQRIGGEGCVDPTFLQPAVLSGGTDFIELQLLAGTYLLTAQIVNGHELAYQPALLAQVRITVKGPVPNFNGYDGGACP